MGNELRLMFARIPQLFGKNVNDGATDSNRRRRKASTPPTSLSCQSQQKDLMLGNLVLPIAVLVILALLAVGSIITNTSPAVTVVSGDLEGTMFGGVEDTGGSPPPRLRRTGPVTGELVFVGRGCPDGEPPEGVPGGDPFLNEPSGKIAVLRRGGCLFSSKILNAQAADALAVVVADNLSENTVLSFTAPDPAIAIPVI